MDGDLDADQTLRVLGVFTEWRQDRAERRKKERAWAKWTAFVEEMASPEHQREEELDALLAAAIKIMLLRGPGERTPEDVMWVSDWARTSSVFKPLRDAMIEDVAQNAELRRIPPRSLLFQQGDERLEYYVVLTGKVQIWEYPGEEQRVRTHNIKRAEDRGHSIVPFLGKKLAELPGGVGFGEISILSRVARGASAYCSGGADVLVLGYELYNHTLRFLQQESDAVSERSVFLKQIDVLNTLNKDKIMKVAYDCKDVTHPRGALVFRQGDEVPGVWFVVEGEVRRTRFATAELSAAEVLAASTPASLAQRAAALGGGGGGEEEPDDDERFWGSRRARPSSAERRRRAAEADAAQRAGMQHQGLPIFEEAGKSPRRARAPPLELPGGERRQVGVDLGVLGPGTMLGVEDLLSDAQVASSTARAESALKLLFINEASFRRHVLVNAAVTRKVDATVSGRRLLLQERVRRCAKVIARRQIEVEQAKKRAKEENKLATVLPALAATAPTLASPRRGQAAPAPSLPVMRQRLIRDPEAVPPGYFANRWHASFLPAPAGDRSAQLPLAASQYASGARSRSQELMESVSNSEVAENLGHSVGVALELAAQQGRRRRRAVTRQLARRALQRPERTDAEARFGHIRARFMEPPPTEIEKLQQRVTGKGRRRNRYQIGKGRRKREPKLPGAWVPGQRKLQERTGWR